MSATRLLGRSDVEKVLTPGLCNAAVEDAFRRHALGDVPEPGILGLHDGAGSFHDSTGTGLQDVAAAIAAYQAATQANAGTSWSLA